MNYLNITYDEFIANTITSRGQWNVLDETVYWEGHHIVPRCLGGEGKARSKHPNIIWLLPHEHFIAHYLLCLKYPDNYKIGSALHAMMYGLNRSRVHIDPTQIDLVAFSELYEKARILVYQNNSERSKLLAAELCPETRSARASCGGQALKLKLVADEEFRHLVSEKHKERHRIMPLEEKAAIYEKAGQSRQAFNQTDFGKQRLEKIKLKNIQTNREVSKQWRSEFLDLFGHTPEWFRKCGKQQEVCTLYKELRTVPDAKNIAKAFVENCLAQPRIGYKCTDPEARSERLKNQHKINRDSLSKYIYQLDDFTFSNSYELAQFLESQYNINFSNRIMAGLTPYGWTYDSRCRKELKVLCEKLNTKIKVIEKEKQYER